MSNNKSLFNNFTDSKSLNPNHQNWINGALNFLQNSKKNVPGFSIPDEMPDELLFKLLEDVKPHVHQDVWSSFLELLAQKGIIENITSPILKNYLLIHLSKKINLSRFLNPQERLSLAYTALHSGKENRSLLLKNIKNFNLEDEKHLYDVAFKAILMGHASDFDIYSFTSISFDVAKQLILTIAKSDMEKAKAEALKLRTLFPSAIYNKDFLN